VALQNLEFRQYIARLVEIKYSINKVTCLSLTFIVNRVTCFQYPVGKLLR
jgi:hypothetical protein